MFPCSGRERCCPSIVRICLPLAPPRVWAAAGQGRTKQPRAYGALTGKAGGPAEEGSRHAEARSCTNEAGRLPRVRCTDEGEPAQRSPLRAPGAGAPRHLPEVRASGRNRPRADEQLRVRLRHLGPDHPQGHSRPAPHAGGGAVPAVRRADRGSGRSPSRRGRATAHGAARTDPRLAGGASRQQRRLQRVRNPGRPAWPRATAPLTAHRRRLPDDEGALGSRPGTALRMSRVIEV